MPRGGELALLRDVCSYVALLADCLEFGGLRVIYALATPPTLVACACHVFLS